MAGSGLGEGTGEGARAEGRVPDLERHPARAGRCTGEPRRALSRGARLPGRVPVHPRHPAHDVPGPPLDDAPVRRLRERGGRQRPVPLPLEVGADRALGGVRPSDADGARRGPPAGPRRGGQGRRLDQLAAGHGGAAQGDSAGRGLDLDDHQLDGGHSAVALRRGRRAAGRADGEAVGHGPERHPQGVHRPRHLRVPAAGVAAAGDRRLRLLRAARTEVEPDQHQRVPHPRGRLDGGTGDCLHARQRHRLRGRGPPRRPGGRRIRRAAVVLLQRPQQLHRGDRQVPRGAPGLGAG